MMRRRYHLGLFLVLAGLVGCGARAPVPQNNVDDRVRLGTTIDTDLARLLEEPRPVLAKKLAEIHDTALAQAAVLKSKPAQARLLPRLNTPREVLLHRPAFSETLGFSLPSYNSDGKPDLDLALHYARHGDFEAAKKLAPTSEDELNRVRPEKNYPVEWTMYVAAAQHLAELKLVEGKPEGATELAVLHKQLQDLLDDKARSGPLGALLLPVGKQTLTDGAAAWRKHAHSKPTLADDMDTAVQNWGDVPAPQPFLTPGANEQAIARVFGKQTGPRGYAVSGDAALRACDLLALPVVRDGIDGFVAFVNNANQLAELQVVYAGKTHERHPEPRHLAWPLVNRGGEGKEPPAKAALPRAAFAGGNLVYDVTLFPRSNALGALIRINDARADPLTASLPADPLRFAPLQLDRSFETNRLALDRHRALDPKRGLVTDKAEVLANLQQPVRDPLPAEAILEREKQFDVVRGLYLRWKAHQHAHVDAAARIAGPLWAAYGPARIEEHEDATSAALVLRWEQAPVMYALRLPYSDTEAVNFAVTFTDHSPDALAARVKAANKLDDQDRQQRLALRKPIERLDRWHFLPGVKLGASRDDVMKLLPRNADWQQRILGQDVVLTNLTQPNPNARPAPTAWLRQFVVRFDANNKVAEIRGLYTDGPARGEPGNPALLDRLKLANGQPETVTASWSNLWTDLPNLGSPAQAYHWQDDVTQLDFQRDSFAMQITLRDNPADAATATALPPLLTVGRGPASCPLGTTRSDVLKKWPNAPTTSDGSLVLVQPLESKFDALIVSFENNQVSRVVGRVREPLPSGPGNLDTALQQFYLEQPTLGLVRRRMPETTGQLLGGWGWHDDRVRVWAFGQETPEGPRIFVEWRTWPVPPPSTTASR